MILAVNNNCFNFNNTDTIPNLYGERSLTMYFQIHHALGARASVFQRDYARLPRLNKRGSTSESKQSVSRLFYKKYTDRIDQKRQKTNSTWVLYLYYTKSPLYLVETHVSYSHGLSLRTVATIFGILWVGNRSSKRPFSSSKNSHFQNEAKCKNFLLKMKSVWMRIKNVDRLIASHLASLWNRGLTQLGNGLLVDSIQYYPLLPFLPCVTLVTICYPWYPVLPYVTLCYPCYPTLPLLQFVTLVTLCYPCYPCYPLLPLLPLLLFVTLVTLCYPFLPLLPFVTLVTLR